MVYWTTRFLIQVAKTLLLRVRVKGLDHIPKNESAILVSNHRSLLDGPLISGIIPMKMHSFIRADYFNKPFWNWFLTRINGIPVMNEKLNHSSFKLARSVLTQKKILTIFPEGGLNPQLPLLPFKSSFVRFSMHYSVPIIPVVIYGTEKVRPFDRKTPRFPRIYVEFLEPVSFEGTKDPETIENVTQEIRQMIHKKIISYSADPSQSQTEK